MLPELFPLLYFWLGDDFTLFYDGEFYWAVRAPSEGYNFIIQGVCKDSVVAEAVDAFHTLLLKEPIQRPIPSWNDEDKKVTWR